MNGDFSRWTGPNAVARHYAGVLMQQGRLHTDADWNEAMQTQLYRLETAIGSILGRAGTLKGEGGFRIGPDASGFTISAGRFFLDGAMVENAEDVTYDAQGGDVAVDPLGEVVNEGDDVIVYLEGTRAHVSARDGDPRLSDPALNGVDTATRIKAAWRVGVERVSLSASARDDLIEASRCGDLPDLAGWAPSTGRMTAGTVPAGELPDDSDCLIPPEAGYLAQENQLYRIQIVQGGTRAQSRFVWSRENGSVEAVLAQNTDGDFILQGALEDEALGFVSGGWVEVYDAANTFNGTSGNLSRITLTDGVVTFSDPIGDFGSMVRPKVRRWDHGGASPLGLPLALTPTVLERGIQVSFTNGTYRVGDYWVFEARAATGNIVWPPYPLDDPADPILPMGWGFRRAPLALGRFSGGQVVDLVDIRGEFPSLNCLQAEDVGFDDDACNLGADTVQEALEVLCQRTSTGLCTFVVSNASELEAAVASLGRGQSARICLRGASFPLRERLLFDQLGHIVIEGTGPQSIVSVAETEPAFAFRGCASVRVTDLSVNGGPTGIDGRLRQDGRLGAITAINCRDVAIERVRARCRAGLHRMTACISTRNVRTPGQVLIRDCKLRVGQSQIGIQVISPTRTVIENNTILPDRVDGDIIRRRILADAVLVNAMRRAVLTFPGPRNHAGNVVIRGGLAEAPREGVPLQGVFTNKVQRQIEVTRGRGSVTVHMHPSLERPLLQAINRNGAASFPDQTEFRRYIRNIIVEGIRSPSGRALVGSRRFRVIPAGVLQIERMAYMAQGIVVGGASIAEAHVLSNRIERANDGIRVAASSENDGTEPDWRSGRPPNVVARARVNGNVITTQPVAAEMDSHGIFLGNVENVSVGENDISATSGIPPDPDRPIPHFGVFQFGYRGPRLTVTENSVANLYNGYTVIPDLDDRLSGIWRLRDNAASGCARNYVHAIGVEVI